MAKIIERECQNCGKKIYVQENFVRKQMFCTLGCMDTFSRENIHNY